jgi:autophagy-related protein 11
MQVFAAFNLGRPNYFLKPTGDIAEQVKTREWIVARITDITDGLVDGDDPTTNPYALAAGSKYFMLEAEPYTVRSSRERAKSPPGKTSSGVLPQRRASASDVLTKTVAAAATQRLLQYPG